jgi:MFS family permease
MPLPSTLAPLRHRPFALFWSGAFISNIGTWMETVAVGILVTETTGKAAWAGIIAAAGFLPGAFLGPLGGAIADRFARKRVLIISTLAQLVLAVVLCGLAIAGTPEPAVVAVIVFIAGCGNALGFPSYQAMMPDLVPPEDLVGAIGLSSAQWNLGRVIGPSLAGLVIALGGDRWGYAAAFAVNAASFLAVVLVVASLTLPGARPGPHPSIVASIRQGFSYSFAEPGIRTIVVYMTINSLLAAPFIALVAPMAKLVLDAGDAGVSVLVTAQGLGAVTMAVSLGSLTKRFGGRRVMTGALWALPVALVLYAGAPNLWTAAVGIFVVGALYICALSSFTSGAQMRAPAAIRGRVMSVLNVLLGLLYPIGSVIQGRLADSIGQRVVTAGVAVVMLVALAAIAVLRPGLARRLDDDVLAVADIGVAPPVQARP